MTCGDVLQHVMFWSSPPWQVVTYSSVTVSVLSSAKDKAQALSRWMYPGAIRSLCAPCPGASGDRCPCCQDICFLWATLCQDLLSHLSQADNMATWSLSGVQPTCSHLEASPVIKFDYLIVEANKQAEKSNNQKIQNTLIIWLISNNAFKKNSKENN